MTALCLGMQQYELGALYIEGLTGDYRKARIMVILFAEPRWKIRPGWRIYFSAMKLMERGGREALFKSSLTVALKSVHLETLLDGMGRFPANTVHALLSPGIQFPANFAI